MPDDERKLTQYTSLGRREPVDGHLLFTFRNDMNHQTSVSMDERGVSLETYGGFDGCHQRRWTWDELREWLLKPQD